MTVTGKGKLSKCARCHSITYCGRECQREDWPRHSQFCIPVMVTEIPGKGLGLVASKDFKKGQTIFKETAAIALHAPSNVVLLQELKEEISKMSVEQKTKFYKLTPKGRFNQAQLGAAFRENCLLELDILESNSLVFGDNDKKWLFLFLSQSFLNHSCAPNVKVNKTDDTGLEASIVAIKDISKGDEVTDCYTEGFMTSSQMKTMLQEVFMFNCECGVCSGSIPHQDRLISEISSRAAIAFSRPLDLAYQWKKKEWMTEASQVEKIADLAEQLYVGHIADRLKVFLHFVMVSQMARDPIRLKKAKDLMKEATSAIGLPHIGTNQETKLETWSSEFQSKRNPTKQEMDDFFAS